MLPEVGGKVWGAVEKSTGEEFIYKNEVLKFRDIGMRGPWTSGGVEFNFGIIGHTPTTATPVDYKLKENKDGSVSCIVGATDLPSGTQWRVEINLQKDKAYFETKASWYNATPLTQSYYNWMTAAAVAKNDLEFFIPGNKFLEHNGQARLWPIDKKGRDLSLYKNNNFGSHKSYHIVGDYKDFFGGYYHNTDFGFGHWSPYEEMPGQKLWLWALSRSGGIWEDLLTDTDGQYIEFQAGRLHNQYFPGENINPITQANFEPYVMDRWKEIWFPFKDVGGMVDASEYGVLNVRHIENECYVGINALQHLNETVSVFINDQLFLEEKLTMKPMDVFSKTISVKASDKIRVVVGDNKLRYTNNVAMSLLKRPFYTDTILEFSKTQKLYRSGWEAMKYRDYSKAFEDLSTLIKINPSHKEALVKLAELEYRKTNYKQALSHVNTVLQMDTYHPEANYKAGIIYRAEKDYVNALESLGWAARSMEYRSASYAQMAEIYLKLNNSKRANIYALKALNFNTYNLNARIVLLILARLSKNDKYFNDQASAIIDIDPLNHVVNYESDLFYNKSFNLNFSNEFPAETLLELAVQYYNLGRNKEAIQVLKANNNDVKTKLWNAYLLKEDDRIASEQLLDQVLKSSSDFVFPYRRETLPVLEWATQIKPHWKLKYYLAQNYIALGLINKGKKLLKDNLNKPDSEIFYRFRANYLEDENYEYRHKDYMKALTISDKNWKLWDELSQFYLKNKNYKEAYLTSKKAFKMFPNNYNIRLLYAKSLLELEKYKECLLVLKNTTVLPSELAMLSRTLYLNAHLCLANKHIKDKKYAEAVKVLNKSKEWPENLGVGKPYSVDNRFQNYLLAICFEKENNIRKRDDRLGNIISYSIENSKRKGINKLFHLLALNKLGRTTELNQELLMLDDELVKAFFNKDSKKLFKLKKESKKSRCLWNVIENSTRW